MWYNKVMDSIIRNVADIGADDRRSLEHVVGQNLQDDQKLVIQVLPIESVEPSQPTAPQRQETLPDWCNVYEGLSDAQISEVEAAALDRTNWSRHSQ